MNLVTLALLAGAVGTLTMDVLNLLFARAEMLSRIDVRMIGRMAAGWARGRFRYGHPSEMAPVAHEKVYGFVTHYAIGIGLALLYVFGWEFFVAKPVSPIWAIAYGAATSVFSYFLAFPSMGLGVCGRRSPDGRKAPLSSLANHVFYGLGLAIGIAAL